MKPFELNTAGPVRPGLWSNPPMMLNKTWLLTHRRQPHHRSDALNHGQGERWSVAASDAEAKRLRARDIVATKRLLAALRREHGGLTGNPNDKPSLRDGPDLSPGRAISIAGAQSSKL
jgi:hypothetical protein